MSSARNPVIAVSLCIDRGEKIRKGHDYFYVNRAYSKMIAACGGTPVFVSPDCPAERVLEGCDGLVIPGGDDIDPALYSEVLRDGQLEAADRIAYERQLLTLFERSNKPVLGVCYGMQLMNVHFGGTLFQSLVEVIGTSIHGGRGCVTEHRITLTPDSSLFETLGDSAVVSSFHFQGINKVAPGFQVLATAEDGVVEAIEREALLGVEWHPESDATGPMLYRMFIDRVQAARG